MLPAELLPGWKPASKPIVGRLRTRDVAPDVNRTQSKSTDAAPIACSSEWIDTSDALADVIRSLLSVDAYAIDTEFLRERTYYPRLALVQIAWRVDEGQRIVLIDPLAIDISPLRAVFETDAVAVLHAADQDLEVLEQSCVVAPRRIFDTQIAAGFAGFSTPSLLTLAERVLGVRLSKGDRLTDWTVRPLTSAQQSYGATDVLHLLELRDILSSQLEEVGRLSWSDVECELLRARSRQSTDPSRAWWRLKEGRVLRGSDRLVAQDLCAWRELRAQQEDRPVRFVLPDLAVLAISLARPKTLEALAAVRGVDGRFTRGRTGTELLELIKHATTRSPDDLQLPASEDFDKRLRPALALVSAWIAQLARDARIDTQLLATRADLIAFLRNDPDARLSVGWRNDVAGEAVRGLVAGDAALAFQPNGSLVLERRSHERQTKELAVPQASWAETPAIDE